MIAQMSKAATTYWAAFILMDILLITGHGVAFPAIDAFHIILWTMVAYVISRIFAGWVLRHHYRHNFFLFLESKRREAGQANKNNNE